MLATAFPLPQVPKWQARLRACHCLYPPPQAPKRQAQGRLQTRTMMCFLYVISEIKQDFFVHDSWCILCLEWDGMGRACMDPVPCFRIPSVHFPGPYMAHPQKPHWNQWQMSSSVTWLAAPTDVFGSNWHVSSTRTWHLEYLWEWDVTLLILKYMSGTDCNMHITMPKALRNYSI